MAHLPDAPLPPMLGALPLEGELIRQKLAGSFITSIHENDVPEFAAAALDRLHGSLYASVRHLQLCNDFHPVPHTWVCYHQGEISGVLLFRIESARALVLTEMIMLSQAQADAFVHSVFARYPKVKTISFNAISTQFDKLALPAQRYVFSENYILDLPPDRDTYRARLGKSSRKTIKGYGNRLQKDHPDFAWQALSCAELSVLEQQNLVQRLQQFKRDSMAARNKQAVIEDEESRRLLKLASECGLFGIARINGEICGGSVSCRIGDNYVMLLSAADPLLEQYRLGLLICYWSVCDCIARGALQCHLLWGRYQYKNQLLAVPHDLIRLTVYRSRWQMLLMPATVLRLVARKAWFGLRQWLLYEVQERPDSLSRLITYAVRRVRALKNRKFMMACQQADG